MNATEGVVTYMLIMNDRQAATSGATGRRQKGSGWLEGDKHEDQEIKLTLEDRLFLEKYFKVGLGFDGLFRVKPIVTAKELRQKGYQEWAKEYLVNLIC